MRLHKRLRLFRCHGQQPMHHQLHVGARWVAHDQLDRSSIGPSLSTRIDNFHQLSRGEVRCWICCIRYHRQLLPLGGPRHSRNPHQDQQPAPETHSCVILSRFQPCCGMTKVTEANLLWPELSSVGVTKSREYVACRRSTWAQFRYRKMVSRNRFTKIKYASPSKYKNYSVQERRDTPEV